MRKPFVFVTACLLAAAGFAEDMLQVPVMGDPLSGRKENTFVFSLLPKAFRKNPELDMTVICQLTDYGRTLPAATPQAPLYYISYDAGHRQMGVPSAGEKLPKADYLRQLLQRSLSANGYLPANEKTPAPALVLIYHWGSHYREMLDEDLPSMISWQDIMRGQIERARLIGGQRFNRDFRDQGEYGFPLLDNSFRNEFLSYQARNDLYYVVVSAYDFTALGLLGERRLVWRAQLTVNAQGVAMAETLPPLVLTASAVFGRDMKEPQIVMRPVLRGTVNLAPLIILGTENPGAVPHPP